MLIFFVDSLSDIEITRCAFDYNNELIVSYSFTSHFQGKPQSEGPQLLFLTLILSM